MGANPSFIEDETTLGSPDLLRVFNLEGLGVNASSLLSHLAPFAVMLKPDWYDVINRQCAYLTSLFPKEADEIAEIKRKIWATPDLHTNFFFALNLISQLDDQQFATFERISRWRRKRSVATLELTRHLGGEWRCKRLNPESFTQEVEDSRNLPRVFTEMPKDVFAHPEMQKFLSAIAEVIYQASGMDHQKLTIHRMYALADAIREGDNAPEGPHKDGADYIVSAMVIRRHEVLGAESIVCHEADQNQVYLKRALQLGEGILQADSPSKLLHDVTPITIDPSTPALDGIRDIIGFDITPAG